MEAFTARLTALLTRLHIDTDVYTEYVTDMLGEAVEAEGEEGVQDAVEQVVTLLEGAGDPLPEDFAQELADAWARRNETPNVDEAVDATGEGVPVGKDAAAEDKQKEEEEDDFRRRLRDDQRLAEEARLQREAALAEQNEGLSSEDRMRRERMMERYAYDGGADMDEDGNVLRAGGGGSGGGAGGASSADLALQSELGGGNQNRDRIRAVAAAQREKSRADHAKQVAREKELEARRKAKKEQEQRRTQKKERRRGRG